MKILEFSSVKNLGDLWCVIKGFFNCLKTGHCLFLRLVSHVCVTIYRNDQQSFLGVSRSSEAGQFWQKEESFFLFFFCCFCALLQTNSCEKRPLWTSMYLSYHKKAEKTYFWVTQLEYFQSTEMVGQKICQQKMTADWFLANKYHISSQHCKNDLAMVQHLAFFRQ